VCPRKQDDLFGIELAAAVGCDLDIEFQCGEVVSALGIAYRADLNGVQRNSLLLGEFDERDLVARRKRPDQKLFRAPRRVAAMLEIRDTKRRPPTPRKT
jgi:hypothetical protein